MAVRIVTDGGADFKKEQLLEYNVAEIEMPVTFDLEAESVKDEGEFWSKLKKDGTPHTSQPSVQQIEELFLKAKEAQDELVCLFISSSLSGTYENAVAVKKRVGYDGIYLVDTRLASVAEQVAVIKACALRDEGKSGQEICAEVSSFCKKVKLFACLDTLKYLRKGGRISSTVALVGDMINLKPIITFTEEGKVTLGAKAIGVTLGIRALKEKLKGLKIDKNYPLIPIFAENDKNCQMMQKRLEQEFTFAPKQGIGAVIGTHIGPSAFGVVLVTE